MTLRGSIALDLNYYAQLLKEALPRVVHTEDENDRLLAEIEKLLDFCEETGVLVLCVNDARKSFLQELSVVIQVKRNRTTEGHFQSPLSYSACVKTCFMYTIFAR